MELHSGEYCCCVVYPCLRRALGTAAGGNQLVAGRPAHMLWPELCLEQDWPYCYLSGRLFVEQVYIVALCPSFGQREKSLHILGAMHVYLSDFYGQIGDPLYRGGCPADKWSEVLALHASRDLTPICDICH